MTQHARALQRGQLQQALHLGGVAARRLAGNRLQIQRHLHGGLVIEDQPGNRPGSWPGNRGDGRGRPMNRRLVRDGLGGQGRQRGAGCERYVRLGKVRRQRRRGA